MRLQSGIRRRQLLSVPTHDPKFSQIGSTRRAVYVAKLHLRRSIVNVPRPIERGLLTNFMPGSSSWGQEIREFVGLIKPYEPISATFRIESPVQLRWNYVPDLVPDFLAGVWRTRPVVRQRLPLIFLSKPLVGNL